MPKYAATDRLLPQINVVIDRKDLMEAERLLKDVKGGLDKVIIRALRRTMNTGQTDISTAVRKEITLKKKDVDRRISEKLHIAGVKSTGVMTISRSPVPLVKYIRGFGFSPGGRLPQRRKGVSVRVRKSEGTKILRSTFVHVSRAGRLNINERKLRGWGRRVGRLPIEPRYGPTVHGVFEGNPLGNRAVRDLGVVFTKRLDHEIVFAIRQAASRNNAKA
jgi:hypothetical protein